jgi:anaerobic ribonucleoside-triphosphate reductase activating protein
MIKYVPQMTSVVIEEIPDRVTLAVSISNCQGNCVGCHSPFLRTDVGEELTESIIDGLLAANFGVNCFLFLGEGNDLPALLRLARHVRKKGLEVALYSGRKEVEKEIYYAFDYVKVGPYIEHFGPLNSRTTNQRLYKVEHTPAEKPYYRLTDLTARFWHKGIDPNIP